MVLSAEAKDKCCKRQFVAECGGVGKPTSKPNET